jgi:hypothetical protein
MVIMLVEMQPYRSENSGDRERCRGAVQSLTKRISGIWTRLICWSQVWAWSIRKLSRVRSKSLNLPVFEECCQLVIYAYTSLPATLIVPSPSPIPCYMFAPGCASTNLAIGPYCSAETKGKTISRTRTRTRAEIETEMGIRDLC